MGILDAPPVNDRRATGGPYGPKTASALQPFRAALAGRYSAPCNVVVFGDSTEEGTGAGTTSADRNKSWPDRLAQLLRARFPTPGETAGTVAPNYVPVGTASSVLTGWTIGSGWSQQFNWGLSAVAYKSTTAGAVLTYTIPVGVTALDLVYVGGSGTTGFTTAIDGGAASATTGTTGTIADGKTTRLTGWDASTTHTLTVTAQGTNTYMDGVFLYSGNTSSGIRVFNGGHHGSSVANYLSTGPWTWTKVGQSATLLAGVQSIIPADPSLVIVGWGYNDINSGISASTFATNVSTLVAGVRATMSTKTVPVVYLDKWTPGPTWIGGGATDTWANFRAALAGLAAADPNGVSLSLSSVVPTPGSSIATQASLFNDSGVHANAPGYSMAADAIASLIAA